MKGSTAALGGAVLLGALNTAGDWIWAEYVPEHRAVFGLLHGMLLLMALGLYLGVLRGRPWAGAAGGAGIGLGAAGLFYLLAGLMGYAAMFPAWMALWIGFASWDALVLRRGAGLKEAAVRGAVAALDSG
ncbi:MAG TPA: hypothetical protein VMR21_03150, partial [Vicinamibacteria bacterium]|nr:hypothetical protein [Vicinamibacteria bacterium]